MLRYRQPVNDLTSNQSKYAISFKINLSTKLLRFANDMYLIPNNLSKSMTEHLIQLSVLFVLYHSKTMDLKIGYINHIEPHQLY